MRSLMMSCWIVEEPAAEREEARSPGRTTGRSIWSAAIWAMMNLSNGRSALKLAMTQSRYVYALLVVAILLEDVALRVGIAGDVEPVAGPAFAEARRREQAIDGRLVAGVARVGGELVELLGRRRQADEVVVQPAQQRARRRLGRRRQAGRFQPGEDEAVDIGARRGCVLNVRRRRLAAAACKPSDRADRLWLRFGLLRLACFRARIGRAHRDPLLEVLDHRVGQLAARRHLVRFVLQRRDEQAFVRLVRHDDRARVAAGPHSLGRIQPQAALQHLGVGRMAL